MKYLKWLILLVIIIIVIVLLLVNLPQKEQKKVIKKKINLSFDDVVTDNVNFYNINIMGKNDYYYLTANMTNLTADPIIASNVQILVTDDKNETITLIGYFGGEIKGDETKTITVKTKHNLKNIKKVNFTLDESK